MNNIQKKIDKLENVVKEHIKNEIKNKKGKEPTQKEVEKIYKKRMQDYQKKISFSSKGYAIGGPVSL